MMASENHVSRVASSRFDAAVREALCVLRESGRPFTVAQVIQASRYPDGSSVGPTTIYAKSPHGKRVHGGLLSELKFAAAESASRLRATKAGAKASRADSSQVYKQLVEQESRLHELEASVSHLKHRLVESQGSRYIVSAALNMLSHGAVLDLVRQLRELERSIMDEGELRDLRSAADKLAAACRRMA